MAAEVPSQLDVIVGELPAEEYARIGSQNTSRHCTRHILTHKQSTVLVDLKAQWDRGTGQVGAHN